LPPDSTAHRLYLVSLALAEALDRRNWDEAVSLLDARDFEIGHAERTTLALDEAARQRLLDLDARIVEGLRRMRDTLQANLRPERMERQLVDAYGGTIPPGALDGEW
jgi:hypothetical protein